MKSILIVDDHPTVGYGTKTVLEKRFHGLVTYVMNGKQAIEKLQEQRYDVVLCDFMLPHMDGISLAKQLKLMQPDIQIAMYTGYTMDVHYNSLVDAGIQAIFPKELSFDDLEISIMLLIKGYSLLPTTLINKLRVPRVLSTVRDADLQEEIQLEADDIELLQGIMQGYSNKELAQLSYRSQRAVEYHISKLYNKLNVKSRWELMKYAYSQQLLDEAWTKQQTV